MRLLLAAALAASAAWGQIRVIAQPDPSPLVTFRIVFTVGSAADPAGKAGVAALTARMLADSGSKNMTYQQIVDARFPMAADLGWQTDMEMTTFAGATHIDNLTAYYRLLRAQLLEPGWREDDFRRVRDEAVNAIRTGLRGNDEELAKEVLYENLYSGTPYGHPSLGTVSSLEKLTLADVQTFYRSQYSQSNLILGINGGFPAAFLDQMKKDFRVLPESSALRPRFQPAPPVEKSRAVLVQKDTRSVAISIGFPIPVRRDTLGYAELLLAASYLGQHRMSGGVLYDELRERRGLNYGDYAYIEYFPRGMYLMEPPSNLPRHQEIFQIWIRPVEPPNAVFATRMALYELNKLVNEGVPEDAFERTRAFLSKYVNVLLRTPGAQLGYAIDSLWYGVPDYREYLQTALAKMTREDVNRVVRQHLRANRYVISVVAKDAANLKALLASGEPSPMKYNAPKPAAITEVDRVAEKLPLGLKGEDIQIIPVDEVFQ